MNYKEETLAAYNTYAQKYMERTKDFTLRQMREQLEKFVSLLPGKKVLDLGCGPGRDALLLKERGAAVTCVDNSLAMIDLCKQRGLAAYQMDFEELSFPARSFDGVWAFSALHHLPKSHLPTVFEKIRKILNPSGVFFIGMKEGEGEGYQEDSNYPGTRRFAALYQDEELQKLLKEHFSIVHSWRFEVKAKIFLTYLCKPL